MYGRGSVFSASNYNNSYNSGNYSTGSYGSNSYNNSSNRRIGSQRTDYRPDEPSKLLRDTVSQWDKTPPFSIVAREETIHMTTTQLRLEDYYLMRKGQMSTQHQNKLKDAINCGSFNKAILDFQFQRLPPVSEERQLDIDAIRGRGNYGNDYYRNDYGRNDSRSDYRNDNRNDSIFSRDSNYSSNIFGRGPSGGNSYSNRDNRGPYTSQNIFGNSSSNNSGNSGNIFSNRGNSYNSGNSGNIFGNSNNSSGNNIFSNNSNNSGGNIFSNRNNNSGGNIFSNNNNSGGNIFNNNNNNNGGNIFGNRSNGNNLFTSNNNNNPTMSQQMLFSLQMMFEENRQFMQKISEQLNPNLQSDTPDHYEYVIDTPSPFDDIKEDNSIPPPEEFLRKKKKDDDRIVIIREVEVDRSKMGKSRTGLSRITDNSRMDSRMMGNNSYQATNSRLVSASELLPNRSKAESRIGINQIPAQSSRLNSYVSSRMGHTRNIPAMLQYPLSCTVELDVQIQWLDDTHSMMPIAPFHEKMSMADFKPQVLEWQYKLISQLKARHPAVRKDAQIQLQDLREDSNNNSLFHLKIVLHQKIINVPEGYHANYSKIVHNELHNLIIYNQLASISWQKPIRALDLDFRINNQSDVFQLTENAITCQLQALNQPCRVVFFRLPKEVAQLFKDQPQKAKLTFGEYVAKLSQGKFIVADMWSNGWQMHVSSFPEVEIEQDI